MASLDAEDITIRPLLCIGGQSTRMGSRKELLPFPDGRLAFEHAIDTIQDAFPRADTIFISLHDESQLGGIRFRLETDRHPSSPLRAPPLGADIHQHEPSRRPTLELIFDLQEYGEIGPAAGLLAAHAAHSEATFLVLGCDYPLIPPTALQQLILEYEPPVTCFLNAEGFSEPLIAIWSPEALEKLKINVEHGMSGLNRIVKMLKRADGQDAKLVRPLRDEWITGCNNMEEWEEAMQIIKSRGV